VEADQKEREERERGGNKERERERRESKKERERREKNIKREKEGERKLKKMGERNFSRFHRRLLSIGNCIFSLLSLSLSVSLFSLSLMRKA